jgi:Tfp pilus assembly protein PilE
MGQQQLLLIILGVIIVGIAVAVGITMFRDNAVHSNRDAIANDLMHLAAKAKHYYRRPASMGGGGHNFTGLTADAAGMVILVTTGFSDNSNATYTIKTAGNATSIEFRAVGKAPLDNGSFPTVDCLVTQNNQTITIVN